MENSDSHNARVEAAPGAEKTATAVFGHQFRTREHRVRSYYLVEEFIANNHTDWDTVPNTDSLAAQFRQELAALDDGEISFLLCHTGFIPESYGHDSSQETLYSKLVEVIVLEWALRLGFAQSTIPTQKASTEDVTIRNDSWVIVCDAKAFRLGRSQKAPNVKDALKQGDIAKWLESYDQEKRLGGLVAFPSQHDWSRGSDFYVYTTDGPKRTAMLYYEHMAFLLLSNADSNDVVALYQNYGSLFPTKIQKKHGNRDKYHATLKQGFLDEFRIGTMDWSTFNEAAQLVIREKVGYTLTALENHVEKMKTDIREGIKAEMTYDALVEALATARFNARHGSLLKQLKRIAGFRDFVDVDPQTRRS